MKFSVDPDQLRVAASRARSIVARSQSAPVLANVLIETVKDQVKLRATDIQSELEVTLDAEVEEEGGTTVNANIFNEMAKRFSSGIPVNISYDAKKERLKINAGATDCSLLTMPRDDFPAIDNSEYDVTFNIESKVLLRLFEMSKTSVAPDSARKYLQGVYLHILEIDGDSILRAVSSDGFRMAVIDAKAPTGSEDMQSTIIPLKAVLEIIKMMELAGEFATVSVSENKVRVTTENFTFSSRVLNAEFPDYKKLIPESANIKMQIDAASGMKALERLNPLVSPHNNIINLIMETDLLTWTISSPITGKIREEVEVVFPHEDRQIAYHYHHMISVFQLYSEGVVTIDLQPNAAATVFRSDEDTNSMYVVMPVRA